MKYWIIGDDFLSDEIEQEADAQGYLKELIPCRDCRAFDEKNVLCKKNNMIAVRFDDWCSRAVRKEE